MPRDRHAEHSNPFGAPSDIHARSLRRSTRAAAWDQAAYGNASIEGDVGRNGRANSVGAGKRETRNMSAIPESGRGATLARGSRTPGSTVVFATKVPAPPRLTM
jgi:hypothetical protein